MKRGRGWAWNQSNPIQVNFNCDPKYRLSFNENILKNNSSQIWATVSAGYQVKQNRDKLKKKKKINPT